MKNLFGFTLVVVGVLAMGIPSADAGCGCDKAPPAAAAVRPAFASPGDEVTLFSSELQEGVSYRVRFDGWRDVHATPVKRRDFADGVEKLQLVVKAPWLFPGPTEIKVERSSGGSSILKISEKDFTMLQPAVSLPESNAQTVVKCYRAAVGADGTVYFPFDVGAIAERTVFSGIGKSYPLLFGAQDVVIYNTQGVVMQLLGPEAGDIFAIEDPLGSPDSLELVYDRHEFQTYRDAHQHTGGLGLDPADPRWHADGTRHVDHDHLVLAIRGIVENQGRPRSGMTPPFKLDVLTMVEGEGAPVASTKTSWGFCGYGNDDDDH
jgi:hypothetical protein